VSVLLLPSKRSFHYDLYFRQDFDKLKDPTDWPSSRGFKYSTTTSNTVLRKHLDRYHKDEYLKLAKEKGWTTILPSVKMQEYITPVEPKMTMTFSPEHVLHKLVCFIAANDQVGLIS
jgi:hypothetical protein